MVAETWHETCDTTRSRTTRHDTRETLTRTQHAVLSSRQPASGSHDAASQAVSQAGSQPGRQTARQAARQPASRRKHPENCRRELPKTIEISLKHLKNDRTNTPKPQPKQIQKTTKTHPKHSQNTSKTHPKHIQSTPKTPKTHPKHTQNAPKTLPKHTQTHIQTHIQNTAKTHLKHT